MIMTDIAAEGCDDTNYHIYDNADVVVAVDVDGDDDDDRGTTEDNEA